MVKTFAEAASLPTTKPYIRSLTREQKARFAEWRDKWIEIGLCTKPANREQAEKAIVAAYAVAGLAAPKIVWCGSPLSQGLTRA